MQENITLYCKADGSDKKYTLELLQQADGWVVNFAYGKRLGTQKPGTKTATALPYAEAKAIYDDCVKAQIKKKYTLGEDAVAYEGTVLESRATGQQPQLLNAIDDSQLEALFTSSEWSMEEKKDGERRPIQKTSERLIGSNKLGIEVGLPVTVTSVLNQISGTINLDGEAVGDYYYVFDCLEIAGEDLRDKPYAARRARMATELGKIDLGKFVQILPFDSDESVKRTKFQRIKDAIGEGVVFKKLDAKYSSGRPSSGGPQLKFKFFKDVTVIVTSLNAKKRSVGVSLLDEAGKLVPMGNCTIPANAKIPVLDSLLELQYQKVARGGKLVTAIYQYVREDVRREDCTMAQLVYSIESIDDDE